MSESNLTKHDWEYLERRFTEIGDKIRELRKPSTLQRFWAWCKQNNQTLVVSILLSLLVVTNVPNPIRYFVDKSQPTPIEQQAAQGGAAAPFWNGNLSPSLSETPPEDLNEETTDTSSMSTSAPPLPPSPQADNGQPTLTGHSRTSIRRTR